MAAMDDDMKDLFGSESEEEERKVIDAPSTRKVAGEEENGDAARTAAPSQMRDLFGSEDEDEDIAVPGTAWPEDHDDQDEGGGPPEKGPPMVVVAPLCSVPPPADVSLVKSSNILGIESEPWDAASFAAVQASATARERVRDLTTIRWRWVTGPDGNRRRESNARLVRWSDSSQQLLLGHDVLDVRTIDVRGDQQYLLARHAQTIQGQGQLSSKLVFHPASLSSSFHRRLAASVEGAAARQGPKVRGTATVADPARAKRDREIAEEARIRDRERLAERKAKTMRKYGAYRAPAPRLSSAYLEEDDDAMYGEEDEVYDNRAQFGGLQRARFDPEEEARAAARLAAAKRGFPEAAGKRVRTVDSEEEEELSDEEDNLDDFLAPDDEEEGAPEPPPRAEKAAPSTAQPKRRTVLLDSDDDE